ncbi:Protein split ends [Eumeta japonica]|uniref:Protein split ends n=1 Tax=Eumeta variegata TaxID=151549 RepID=A0A4C1WY58_EUMVA|nr:Protein split ends [Eumeta japonica]
MASAHSVSPTAEEKIDEKARAVISQEETEDAVAALLGESFGGKDSSFGNRYNEVEQPAMQIETTCLENENIREEDAEEMRRAVQNLNASEMELKPDTPMSDNDLLLIDTDNEEGDESQQDAIDRLPVNIIATNPSLTNNSNQNKCSESSDLFNDNKPIPTVVQATVSSDSIAPVTKAEEVNAKFISVKREILQQITSTATPVITSWTLTNNKLRDSHLISSQDNQKISKETNDNTSAQVNTNIVHVKPTSNHNFTITNTPCAIISPPNRMNTPYQVINPVIRPGQVANMQPPTIKIPEPHLLYHKQQGIVISPRLASDTRLQSPKSNPQNDGITSSRVTNMTILSTSSQNINPVGIASSSAMQQRSPGHVTVVRMQQPPLSPIQTMHIPHGTRAMVSPNRPSSVLVQTQTTPIHFNRLPGTPVLAPLTKPLNSNLLQSKTTSGTVVPIIHPQKITSTDSRKSEQCLISGLDNLTEHSKIILSPSNLQQSTNPTVMAQNRLISMQNAVHPGIHLPNKVVINNIAQLHESRDIVGQSFKSEISKSETIVPNHTSYSQSPVIHVAGANHSTASIIHNGPKSLIGSSQEVVASRTHVSNIIHSLNSQRLVTSTPITSVIQIDTSKCSPSVLSMANIRPQTVVTKFDSPVTSNNLSSVTLTSSSIVTPLLTKTGNASTSKQSVVSDSEVKETYSTTMCNAIREYNNKSPENVKPSNTANVVCDSTEKKDQIKLSKTEVIAKCETDFEELLKDNTNEIKVTNTPDKKLEVNVGNIVTLISTNSQGKEEITSIHSPKKDNIVTTFPESCPIKEEKNSKDHHVSKLDEKVLEIPTREKHQLDIKIEPKFDICKKELTEDAIEFKELVKQTECKIESFIKKEEDRSNDKKPIAEDSKNQLENNNDGITEDTNIESVIKKVDTIYTESKDDNVDKNISNNIISNAEVMDTSISEANDLHLTKETKISFDVQVQKSTTTGKRGGRGMRGKRSERYRDRVQTRQISKPARGTTVSKRGRGRGRMDKKLKSCVGVATSNLPGDIYDFHEDSGDESKTESRPRLILTIKSPLSGQSSATATSSLSIASKEQKTPEKSQTINKEEKNDGFVSPSPNTRKSRRLQEKDVQRNTVDDVIEDVIKNSTVQTRRGKEGSKKRPTRQTGYKVNYREKSNLSDIRKSPRGTKRTRDRSSSEASIDSSDEKVARKEDSCRDSKLPKLTEATVVVSKPEAEPQNTIKPSNTPVINSLPATTPTPIMKPPKKMISEISAKLASAFESTSSSPNRSTSSPIVAEKPIEENNGGLTRISSELDKQPYREYRDIRNQECAKALSRSEEILQAATAETPTESHTMDVNFGRRLVDGVAGNVIPVGALEAADARVQSPALPHRPPSIHRPGPAPAPAYGPAHAPAPADRATPILIRAGEGDIGVAGGSPGTGLGVSVAMGVGTGAAAAVGVGVGAVPTAGGARTYRAPYAGTASLPRGAHHPPPPPLVAHPHHPLHAAHKQSAIVGSHHHTTAPPPGARVTITSVPSISPKSQMPMGDGVYSHFSHQHYQMFQQQFRVTLQENRTTPSPFTRIERYLNEEYEAVVAQGGMAFRSVNSGSGTGCRLPLADGGSGLSPMEAEGSEAPTPPLELRRPVSARVPRPAHSPSPADRLFSGHGGRSPPPAHGGAVSAGRVPAVAGAMPPHGPHGPPGPLHASQVPREADSLQMLLRRYPVMWQGLLALKNDCAAVQMHFVHGNPSVAGGTLPRHVDGSTPPLRIAQRMRLEPAQLEQVHRKMKMENEHCMLLALPCGRDHMDVLQQSNNLTAGFITYLQRKQAAGIVNVAPPGHQQAMYTVHIFPSCDFANENLNRIAPDLMHRVADIAHLLIVIATV